MAALRVAITLDDAPSIAEQNGSLEPGHMDAIRETLKSSGVTRCVAFVVARTALGHEAVLERWLADGYELGNHTFEHPRARNVGVKAFTESIGRCHELLERIGAFRDGRTAWFRFPYLSRGRHAKGRRAIQAHCESLGYRVAHASVDFYDDRFEKKFGLATHARDMATAAAIAQRYEDVAIGSLRLAAKRAQRALGRDAPLVPYCHFGPLSRQKLGNILERLRASGLEFCSLEEALADPMYEGFNRDYTRDGLVTPGLPRSLLETAARTLVRLSEFGGFAEQRRLGPRWPHHR